ncbi:glycosyltransferase [Lacrimispora saccharolytica]|nr:glycosyltransferase [Lacrimispora saccharolytica]
MKKKIVFVMKALWIGGIETALVNLLKEFDYDKYDVTLLVLKAELDMLGQIHPKCRVLIVDRDETVTFQKKYRFSRLYHLTEEPENPSLLHKAMIWTVPLIRWVENCLYIRYIRKLMRDEKFDTVVIYSDVAGETAVKAIKSEHYLMFYHHGAIRCVYHDAVAYRRCEKIIAVSVNQAVALREFHPKYKDKIVVVHNLTDVDGIRKKAEDFSEEKFDGEKFNIVSVGRVSHEKGMDIAVRACAELVKNGYSNICWWIVGDGPAMQEVKALIKELCLEKYVITTGMKKNPYPYIRQADLYVQPSRFEAFGLTILEAMILGKAVVATSSMGASEIIDDGKTGLLCEANADKMSKRIEHLIRNPEELRELTLAVHQMDLKEQNKYNMVMLEKLL